MYEELAPLIRGVMDGYSACVFAYGQTSSGKTFTMSGPMDQERTEEMHGIQYRALRDLFQQVRMAGTAPHLVFLVNARTLVHCFARALTPRPKRAEFRLRSNTVRVCCAHVLSHGWGRPRQAEERTNTHYTVSVQMLEIYNDQLRDLLVDARRANDLKLVDGVVNTRSVEVHNTLDVLKVTRPTPLPQVRPGRSDRGADGRRAGGACVQVMEEGERNRSTGSTALNVASSRSHSVTTVVVEGRDVDTGEGYRAKLQLVDLAGSERVSHSQVEGERLKEAQYINRYAVWSVTCERSKVHFLPERSD